MKAIRSALILMMVLAGADSYAEEYDPIKIGVGFGQVSYKVPKNFIYNDGSFSRSSTEDAEDTVFYFTAMTKPLEKLGLEFSYFELGEMSSSNTSNGSGPVYPAGKVKQTVSFDGIALSAVLDHKPRPNFSIFAKLGFYKLDVSASGFRNDATDQTGRIFGYGFEFEVSKPHSVKLEFIMFKDVGGVSTVLGDRKETDIDTTSLVYLYTF